MRTPERAGMEAERAPEIERLRNIKRSISAILESADVETAVAALRGSAAALNETRAGMGEDRFRRNAEWLDDNNNRVNLYRIAGQRDEEWLRDEPADADSNEQFLEYRRINAALLRLAEIGGAEAASAVAEFFSGHMEHVRPAESSIDALAGIDAPEAEAKLLAMIERPEIPGRFRTRAILSGLRNHRSVEPGKAAGLLSERVRELGGDLHRSDETFAIIEAAGLIGGEPAERLLAEIESALKGRPFEHRRWFERDILSTRLAVAPEKADDLLRERLGNRHYVTAGGTVIGSLDPNLDFPAFAEKERAKLDRIGEAVERVNRAFGSEPVKFIDITAEKLDDAGWTQNGLYESAAAIAHVEHPDDLAQGAGHEACERWQSKGFVDAAMARRYLQLMGDEYRGSPLEKFRLNKRMSAPTRAGHPWDGEREFIAELGSTLLVDPKQIDKLFDRNEDEAALDALTYLKRKLETRRAK